MQIKIRNEWRDQSIDHDQRCPVGDVSTEEVNGDVERTMVSRLCSPSSQNAIFVMKSFVQKKVMLCIQHTWQKNKLEGLLATSIIMIFEKKRSWRMQRKTLAYAKKEERAKLSCLDVIPLCQSKKYMKQKQNVALLQHLPSAWMPRVNNEERKVKCCIRYGYEKLLAFIRTGNAPRWATMNRSGIIHAEDIKFNEADLMRSGKMQNRSEIPNILCYAYRCDRIIQEKHHMIFGYPLSWIRFMQRCYKHAYSFAIIWQG